MARLPLAVGLLLTASALAAPVAARAQSADTAAAEPPAVRLRNALLDGGNFEVQQQRQLSQGASYSAPQNVRYSLLDAGVTSCRLRFRGQVDVAGRTPVVHLYELPLSQVDVERIRTSITRPGVRLRLYPDPWDLLVDAVNGASAPFLIEEVYPRTNPLERDHVTITMRDRESARIAADALREVVNVCAPARS